MEERKDYEIINVEARIPKIIDVIIPNAIGHGGSMDLSDYYNKGEVDSKVQAVTPDLSTYATKAEVEAKVSTVTGHKARSAAFFSMVLRKNSRSPKAASAATWDKVFKLYGKRMV